MGASILRTPLDEMYLGVLANMDEVAWDEFDQPVEMMDMFNVQTGISGVSFLNDLIVTGLGYAVDKPEGTPSQLDTIYEAGSKKYTPKVKSLMIIITEEAVTDNKYIKILESARGFVKSFKATKERVLASVINNCMTTETTADGVALASTAHLIYPTGATGKNTLSTAADMSVTSVQLAMNDIDATVNERGIPAIISAGRCFVQNPAMEMLACEIFKSYGRSDTTNRADNAFKLLPQYSGMQILKKRWLNDADAWGFLPAKNKDHGLKYREWWPFRTYASEDFETGDMKYKATERYIAGATKWQGFYYVPGA